MASEPKVGDVATYVDEEGPAWQVLVLRGIEGDVWATALNDIDARRLSAELSAAREMREVLREVEWVTHQGVFQQWSQCPCCDNERNHSHAPDCRLARLIGGGE